MRGGTPRAKLRPQTPCMESEPEGRCSHGTVRGREEERIGYGMRVTRNERRDVCSEFGRHARVQAAMGAQFLWSAVIFHFVPRELVGVVGERVLPPGGRPVRLVDDVRLPPE